jgi:hypothetical protein
MATLELQVTGLISLGILILATSVESIDNTKVNKDLLC